MKDEPHSHKKATAVFVAVLLLAYVGSYLWCRAHPYPKFTKNILIIHPPQSFKSWTSEKGLNSFYWPLRKLDKFATDEQVIFAEGPGIPMHP